MKSKTVMSDDGATAALGLITWNGETLEKLASTARVSTKGSKRTVKIGGIANDNGKSYVLCLHHKDKADGDCWYRIVGKNTAGFSSRTSRTPDHGQPDVHRRGYGRRGHADHLRRGDRHARRLTAIRA